MTVREWLTANFTHYNLKEPLIADCMAACSCARGQVTRILKDLGLSGDLAVEDVELTPHWKYEDMYERFREWMGIAGERPATPAKKLSKTVTHGIIACTHAPFQDESALKEAHRWFQRERVDVIHLAGDLADLHSCSHFTKFENVPIQREAVEARKIVDFFSRNYKKVYVMEGNHEARERKYLARALPPDLLAWFLEKSFLQRITQDMENVELVKLIVPNSENYEIGWVHPVGDAVIGHAEKTTKMVDALRGVKEFREWLINGWCEVLGIPVPKVFFNAHSHRAGIVDFGGLLVLCELGCCCKLNSYALSPTKLYGKPQTQAATIFTQTDGVTDVNSVRQLYLGR